MPSTRIGLSRILEVERRAVHPAGLRRNLGDSYLLRSNPVYRNIREQALRAGFRFTRSGSLDYLAWPLVALPEILRSRRIPFVDNVAPLVKLNRQSAGRITLDDLSILSPTRNYLLHEAAHCVAHEVLWPAGGKDTPRGSLSRERIVRILLEEAFANACEDLAGNWVRGRLQRYLFGMNSYIGVRPKARSCLRRVQRRVGRPVAARLLILAYLHSNFLVEHPPVSALRRSLALASAGASPRGARRPAERRALERDLRELFQGAAELSRQFRTGTAQVYFKALRARKNLFELLRFDFLEVMEGSSELQAALTRLSRIALGEAR